MICYIYLQFNHHAVNFYHCTCMLHHCSLFFHWRTNATEANVFFPFFPLAASSCDMRPKLLIPLQRKLIAVLKKINHGPVCLGTSSSTKESKAWEEEDIQSVIDRKTATEGLPACGCQCQPARWSGGSTTTKQLTCLTDMKLTEWQAM